MYNQKINIYLSKTMAETLGLNPKQGMQKVQTKEQLEKLKIHTKGIISGKDGYTLYYDDGSRSSYSNNGILQYYESEYNPDYPLLGIGKSYGLKDGNFQYILNAVQVIQIGKTFVSIGKNIRLSTKSFYKSPKGNIRIEKGIEAVPRAVQKNLGVKLDGPVEKPWHIYFYGNEIRVNPFNPNWRYFPR